MDKKEQWANEVLQSLDGIKSAEPQADLFAKITAKIAKEKVVKIIPLKHLRWVAAAACVIIGVNIYVFNSGINSAKNTNVNTIEVYEILSDYSLYN